MTSRDPEGYRDALSDTAVRVTGGDDASRHQIDGLQPGSVVYPGDLRELASVLSIAAEWGLAIAPWGGGTRMALGNPPERLDLVVDLSELNRVVEHNPGDLTVTVQAGISLAALRETLAARGQFLALDPPLPDRATLGGTLAIGMGGPLKWQYGSPRDVVIGMKVAQADGKVTRSGGQVVKNVSGYDMSRLHIGGLGTLGVIAEVSLKLTPLPTKEATIVAAFDTVEGCIGAALEIFRGDVVALAMTAFDRRADQLMNAIGGSGRQLLAVRLGGRPLTLERQIKETRDACARREASTVDAVDEVEAARLWRSLADFGWDEATAPTIGVRASVVPSRTPGLVAELERSSSSAGVTPAIVTHPAHGTVLVGWHASRESLSVAAAVDLLHGVASAARSLGGHLVIERAPPDVKSRFDVWGDAGDEIAIMRALKEQYDPHRLLNPGRFMGGI